MKRAFSTVVALGLCAASASGQTLEIRDYLTMPMTGSVTATGNNGQLARINSLQEEPGGRQRFFVNDLNGPLYIIDKNTKTPTVYLNLNGRGTQPGLLAPGYGRRQDSAHHSGPQRTGRSQQRERERATLKTKRGQRCSQSEKLSAGEM